MVQSVFDKVERLEMFPESRRVPPELDYLSYREVVASPCRSHIKIARLWGVSNSHMQMSDRDAPTRAQLKNLRLCRRIFFKRVNESSFSLQQDH